MYNQNSKRSYRWRKKNDRGVSPIIATILLVAITVVLAAVLYILISGLTKGPGNTPIGTALSVGKIAESNNPGGTQYNYTTSVQTATSGMTWSNMIFQVQSPTGALVTTGPTKVVISGTNGCNLATYTFSTSQWGATGATCTSTTGGSALVQPGDSLQLQASVNLNAEGNILIIVGQGSYSGSSQVALP
jgi:archaeal type IV pilus assembly protein PilA